MTTDTSRPFETLSTIAVSPHERSGFWREAIRGSFGGLHVDTYGRDAFDGALRMASVGQTRLCRVTAQAHRATNLPAHAADAPRRYKVVVQFEGESRFEQDGLAACLAPGDWAIYDTARPYRMTASRPVDLATMVVPHAALPLSPRERRAVLLRAHSARGGAGGRMAACMAGALAGAAMSEAQAGELGEALAAAVREQLAAAPRHLLPAVLRERIVEYVRCHLARADLCVDQIAAALNCSKRYLHMVFDADGMTLARYIQQLRLAQISQDLADPALGAHSITEISMRWGFVSSGHFSRSFRQAFGTTPRDYRAASLAGRR
ncbi:MULTISPECIES: AraC-like ligand-binding domain-containing protein [Cupriavidus]|uniref:AraC-like ligand-binding domain-containing protein n=1 Tax=Cupriavidus sp. WS TaxID=1312922 RepID=UPI00037875BD|nr:helix-turn-helix domain-containing protein [Cupriavidus sp. WS]